MDLVGTALPVGSPVRDATRRAVLVLSATSVAFMVFAWVTKEAPQFRNATPWANDPYDVVVSFTLFFVPVAMVLMLLRVPLCRRWEPLPVSRITGIQRAGDVLLAAVGITVLADWAAVGLVPGGTSAPAGSGAVAALAVLSAVMIVALIVQVRATRGLRDADATWWGPDWLDDTQTLLDLAASQIDPRLGEPVVGLARTVIDGRLGIRRHPGGFVVGASCGFGLMLAALEALAEGAGSAPGAIVHLAVLFSVVGAAGMAAFLVVAARYLHLMRPAQGHQLGNRGHLVMAATAGAASIPLAVAFRDAIASLSGGLASIQTPDALLLLVAVVALVVSSLTILVRVLAARRAGR